MRCNICSRRMHQVSKRTSLLAKKHCRECIYILDLNIHALRPASELTPKKNQYNETRKRALRIYKQKNHEKISAYQRQWIANNREHVLAYQRKWRKAQKFKKNKELDIPLITVSLLNKGIGGAK